MSSFKKFLVIICLAFSCLQTDQIDQNNKIPKLTLKKSIKKPPVFKRPLGQKKDVKPLTGEFRCFSNDFDLFKSNSFLTFKINGEGPVVWSLKNTDTEFSKVMKTISKLQDDYYIRIYFRNAVNSEHLQKSQKNLKMTDDSKIYLGSSLRTWTLNRSPASLSAEKIRLKGPGEHLIDFAPISSTQCTPIIHVPARINHEPNIFQIYRLNFLEECRNKIGLCVLKNSDNIKWQIDIQISLQKNQFSPLLKD